MLFLINNLDTMGPRECVKLQMRLEVLFYKEGFKIQPMKLTRHELDSDILGVRTELSTLSNGFLLETLPLILLGINPEYCRGSKNGSN